jgi:ribosomal protein S18 acetylase RimI-like enzyme
MLPPDVTLLAGGPELLDRVKPLWLEQRDFHAELAPVWREEMLSRTFEPRREQLLAKAVRGFHVILAECTAECVGYSISTINADNRGEVDSFLVTAAYRGHGIGHALLTMAMQWLKSQQPTDIIVEVLAGNDPALRLYKDFGFRSRTITMQHVP